MWVLKLAHGAKPLTSIALDYIYVRTCHDILRSHSNIFALIPITSWITLIFTFCYCLNLIFHLPIVNRGQTLSRTWRLKSSKAWHGIFPLVSTTDLLS